MNRAGLGDGRDEGRRLSLAEFTYHRESLDQQHRHILPAEVSRSEDERPHAPALNCSPLEFVITDALVERNEKPTLAANKRQPLRISGSGLEVLSVALTANVQLREQIEDGTAVMPVFVEKKNEVIRQQLLSIPSEWPPQSHFPGDRILLLNRLRTPARGSVRLRWQWRFRYRQ